MRYLLVPFLLVFALIELPIRLVIFIAAMLLVSLEVLHPGWVTSPYPDTLRMAKSICGVQ